MGKLVEAAGHVYGGKQIRKAKKAEAKQLKRRAGLTRATAQRLGAEERREARYVMSAARARAAAGGGGVSDPTVVNILADIEARGEYNALVRNWEGEEEAIGLESAAKIAKREGKAAEIAGWTRGIATIMESAQGFGG